MLREERDQNAYSFAQYFDDRIPECSGRSEIKTGTATGSKRIWGYQNAPGGARSKRQGRWYRGKRLDTRMLREERDQNLSPALARNWRWIPECSGRSEIKTASPCRCAHLCDTRMLREERDQNNLPTTYARLTPIPECSGRSEIKTGSHDDEPDNDRYQNAPGGARSKLRGRPGQDEAADTRMLREERDQNLLAVISAHQARIPEC